MDNKNNNVIQNLLNLVGGFFPSKQGVNSDKTLGDPSQMKVSYGNVKPITPDTMIAGGPATGGGAQFPQPTSSPQAMAQQIAQPQLTGNDEELAKQILAGFRKYSKGKEVPVENQIPLMVEAAKKYPIFQKNPYLIPAVSIVETSAGQNWRLNNNPISWAARVQQAGNYQPANPEQSFKDMMSAVGGDPNRGAGYDPETARTRQSQIAPYEKFRQSNNLQDFATTYEDKANERYYPALVEALKYFQDK